MVRGGASRYWDAIERFDAHQTATSIFSTCDYRKNRVTNLLTGER